jgi:segregation and condensation protein B
VNQKALLEAALFVSDSPLSLERLAHIVGVGSEDEVRSMLEEIKYKLGEEDRGIELVETPEGFELRVKPEYRTRVARLAPFADLSDGMMRTLAIIAVKQPVKQSLIVRYQGNKTYNYIKDLEDKGLVKTEKYGRTKLVNTTDDFEKYFGKSSEEMKQMLKGTAKEVEDEAGKGSEERKEDV